ncbi:hypothetical protein AVEN_216164-1 [Araneus ventricosus]|uniref:Uncharacterized protein n=1 Tax=Araneus ventricosus TaxID=182803 RepID=A0A4Y2IAS1_ARAVE|nr:hypothetical protein AVEN_216164-1 [Araneus ventricosus]
MERLDLQRGWKSKLFRQHHANSHWICPLTIQLKSGHSLPLQAKAKHQCEKNDENLSGVIGRLDVQPIRKSICSLQTARP